jgi:hypothetical protein
VTSLFRWKGKLLVRGGKLAIHERCCCERWACVKTETYEVGHPLDCANIRDYPPTATVYECLPCVGGFVQTYNPPDAPPLACEENASIIRDCAFEEGVYREYELTVISVHDSMAACEAACGEEWV